MTVPSADKPKFYCGIPVAKILDPPLSAAAKVWAVLSNFRQKSPLSSKIAILVVAACFDKITEIRNGADQVPEFAVCLRKGRAVTGCDNPFFPFTSQ